MKNILTVCSAGLSRSVGLADVLKLHFEPCDVIPVGVDRNYGVKDILFAWADHIVVMTEKYAERVPPEHRHKVMVCEVGPDVYGGNNIANRSKLIDLVWRWARVNADKLGIVEHQRKL